MVSTSKQSPCDFSLVIAPLFEAFHKVCCLKLGKYFLQFCLNHGGVIQSPYPLTLSWIFRERKKSHGVLNLVSRRVCKDMQVLFGFKFMHKAQQTGTLPRRKNLSDVFRLSGQLLCSDWNEIPNMWATSLTVILLLLKISSFTWLIF